MTSALAEVIQQAGALAGVARQTLAPVSANGTANGTARPANKPASDGKDAHLPPAIARRTRRLPGEGEHGAS